MLLSTAIFFAGCSKAHHQELYPVISSTAADSALRANTVPSFNNPRGVALDAYGNIYVADYGNNLIREITTTGVVSTVAGNGTQGALNGKDTLASFSGPSGLVLDAGGNIYVADAGNNLIRKISSGMVTTLAGSDTTGAANGMGAFASFFSPAAVAVDAKGNLYVADAGNNVIRLITPAGVVSDYAGNGNPASKDGLLDSASFYNPTGLAIDKTGNIFVADYLNNTIRQISPAGLVTTKAGAGTVGAANGPGTAATFYFPRGIAVDANENLYIADEVNNLIRKIDPSGNVSTFAGSGVAGSTGGMGATASFNGPAGVAVDAAGYVYVADANNNSIRKITPAGLVSTIAGSGAAGAINGRVNRLRKASGLKKAY